MLFEVGETVVYPHHGAATIVEVKKRTIRGEEKLYLKLNVTRFATNCKHMAVALPPPFHSSERFPV